MAERLTLSKFLKHVMRWRWLFAAVCVAVSVLQSLPALAAEPSAEETLRARYTTLDEQLNHAQFDQPLVLDSVESPNNLKGDIYARLEDPFSSVNTALNNPRHWCDVLILHLNVKYCRAVANGKEMMLKVNIGRKHEQSLDDSHRVEFIYRTLTATPNYFQVELNAEEGPLSTRNYRIMLEVVAIDSTRTFLHLGYSYDYGLAGRLAMKTYLATIAKDKVGFTLASESPNSAPTYIGGVRGLTERNTMRYFLAINAYLDASSAPLDQQFERRINNWYAATERYSRQLHEVELTPYLTMKRQEYLRQQNSP